MLQDFFGPPPQQTMYQPRYYSDDGPSRHDFGCPCGEDVDSYCSKTDDDDAYASIFEKRLCLGDHFDQLSEQCAAHLASAPTVVEYCRAEILETCRNVQPGENRVHECLLARPTVGDACASYLATLAPPTPPKPPCSGGLLVDAPSAETPSSSRTTPCCMMRLEEPGARRFDAGGFAPPRFSRVEGLPPRARLARRRSRASTTWWTTSASGRAAAAGHEVVVEVDAEEEDAALEEEEAAVASLLVLASARASPARWPCWRWARRGAASERQSSRRSTTTRHASENEAREAPLGSIPREARPGQRFRPSLPSSVSAVAATHVIA